LKNIFKISTIINSLAAILAGLIAQLISTYLGYLAVFDFSLIVLFIGSLICYYFWTENYGNQATTSFGQFAQSYKVLKSDKKVLYLGLIQAFFEAAMYCFVLEWTPSLEIVNKNVTTPIELLPHGLIFACFMLCIMIGTWIYGSIVSANSDQLTIHKLLIKILMFSSVGLIIPAIFESKILRFLGFCVFEMCIGIFWPCLASLRSRHVPEEVRSTLMSIFRIPLNLIVILLLIPEMELATIFIICSSLMVVCLFVETKLYRIVKSNCELVGEF